MKKSKYEETQSKFAKIRPLPPFGKILDIVIGVLQLKHDETYDGSALTEGMKKLRERNSHRILWGAVTLPSTRRQFAEALTKCLNALPVLKRNSISVSVDWILGCWENYERLSGCLSIDQEQQQLFERALFRHGA